MIGLINFSHTEPLSTAIDPSFFIREHPAEILKHVMAGTIDCGMVSLVSYIENMKDLSIMETANIHSRRGTISTLLVSRGEAIKDGAGVTITAHTRTTEFYLQQILAAMHIKFRPVTSNHTEASELLEEAEYALVIGDEAIRSFAGNYRILMDVGYEFSRIFSMPPVYAVTVYRNDRKFPAEDYEILQEGVLNAGKYRNEAAEIQSVKLGVSKTIMDAYYRSIEYDYSSLVKRTVSYVISEVTEA